MELTERDLQRVSGESRAATDRLVPELRAPGRAGPAELAERHGDDTPVLDWRERLVCSRCDGWDVDFVVSGTRKR